MSTSAISAPVPTVYKAGTVYKALFPDGRKNSHSTDAAATINWALANVKGTPELSNTSFAGPVSLKPARYECKSAINLTQDTVGKHGLGLAGTGMGCFLNFSPSSPLPNAIDINIQLAELSHLIVDINANVTNAVRIAGAYPSGQGTYAHISHVALEGDDPQKAGQIGLLHEGGTGWPYHMSVDALIVQNFDIGIRHIGREATSMKVVNFMFRHCKSVAVEINSLQNQYCNGYIQGSPEETHTGFHIKSGGNGTMIDNVMTELNYVPTTGTSQCQSVLIDPGVTLCDITNVQNFNENGTTIKTVRNNSGNTSNRIAARDNFMPSYETGSLYVGSKLGFFDKQPITQRGAIAAPGTDGTSQQIAINAIRQVLREYGLTK